MIKALRINVGVKDIIPRRSPMKPDNLLANEISACRERYKGDLLISVALTDEQWASVEDALRSPARDAVLEIPLKPDLEWLRKVAALCPNMDGTEDMVGVVRGIHGAISAILPRGFASRT